jgi:tRNA threonylcarbamoyladenosine biosynthesis protein TsaB
LRILALDTSERQFSVAALEGDLMLAEIVANNIPQELSSGLLKQQVSSGTTADRPASSSVAVQLFPMIWAVFNQIGWKFSEVELLAVAKGPGSFTGLRSGIVAAKTLAFAAGIPLVAVNTLQALAFQLATKLALQHVNPDSSHSVDWKKVQCVVNAQRRQLYVAKYEFKTETGQIEMKEIESNQIMERGQWMRQLEPNQWLVGTGLTPLLTELANRPVAVAPQSEWNCRASSVGQIAWKAYQTGIRDDLWKLEPLYFRPSYADEKLLENSPEKSSN